MNPLASADAVITIRALPEQRLSAPMLVLNGDEPTWPQQTRAFLSQYIRFANQRYVVIASDEPDEHERAVLQIAAEHYQHARIGQNTVEDRGATWGRNFLLTLRRNPPWATTLGEPYADRPAFVVAAGPSLDKNGHLLREAQKRGPIVALNTSVGACMHHGVVPDVVVCAEATDLRTHFEPLRGLGVPVLLSAVAGKANWAAAENPIGFVHHEPSLIPHALELGVSPINFGGSVACAATAIAMLWGAFPIVLVGQDLAYTEGRCYAEGTPFSDLRAIVKDGVIHVHGASKYVPPQSVVWRQSWGAATEVPTTLELDGFAAWFAKAAAKHLIVNTTEGGMHISGMLDRKLESLLPVMRERPRVRLPPAQRRDTIALRQRMVAAAQAFLQAPGSSVPDALPVLHLWAVPAILPLRGQPAKVQEAAMREALRKGCEEVIEVLS